MVKNLKNFNIFILSLCSIILIIVYYLEYILNLEPCSLCLYQRIPYFAAIFLSLFLLIAKNNRISKFLFYLLITVFFISFFLASYHFGIENNFWSSFISCETNIEPKNNENLKDYLLKKEYISCSNTTFSLFGISLAGYNIIISLFLLIYSLKIKKKNF